MLFKNEYTVTIIKYYNNSNIFSFLLIALTKYFKEIKRN